MTSSQTTKTLNFENTEVSFARLSDRQLRKTYWIFALMNQNSLVKLGTFFIKLSFKLGLPINALIRHTIFAQFCGGETINDCQDTILTLSKAHVGTILDYSVEGEDDEASFDATFQELMRTIERASQNPEQIPFAVFKVTGLASTPLLEKIQLNKEELTPAEAEAWIRVKHRVSTLCALAANKKVRLFFDAEESWIQDVIDELCYEQMAKYNLSEDVWIYNTYQLYRWEALENYRHAVAVGRAEGYKVGAKLVRGAYLEKERRRAHEEEYQDPTQPSKSATDQDYNEAIRFSLQNIDRVAICLGTHNEESSKLCAELMSEYQIAPQDTRIYFAQLLGMSDNISFTLASQGYNVAKYVPYGPVESVMPYLFRRAEENTSIAGQSSREYLLVRKELLRRKKA